MHDYGNNVLRVQLYLLHFLRFNSYGRMAESASKDVDVMFDEELGFGALVFLRFPSRSASRVAAAIAGRKDSITLAVFALSKSL
jgi:hypothetical protein